MNRYAEPKKWSPQQFIRLTPELLHQLAYILDKKADPYGYLNQACCPEWFQRAFFREFIYSSSSYNYGKKTYRLHLTTEAETRILKSGDCIFRGMTYPYLIKRVTFEDSFEEIKLEEFLDE